MIKPHSSRLIELYKLMAELTKPECQFTCRIPFNCCAPEHCEAAKFNAKENWGIDLVSTGHPRLPFMGPTGCAVEPHLRPCCTLHTCAVNSIGLKIGDPAWTTKYFELRNEIELLELERFLVEIENSPKERKALCS